MKKQLYGVLLIITLSMILACSKNSDLIQQNLSGNSVSGKLVITGSSTIAPVVTELARRFELHHHASKVDVQTGGSSRGVSDVRKSISHIGMVSRVLTVKEKDLQAQYLGIDGVSVIVNASNPYAIAYVSIGTAEYDIAHGQTIETLPLRGVTASTKNLLNEAFPLQRQLNLVITDNTNSLANRFLSYIKSDEAQTVIKEYGFGPDHL